MQRHLRDASVVLDGVIEGRTHHFRLDGAVHIGNLFGPLPDEADHQVHIVIVGGDAVGNLLEDGRLACFGRGDDQPALATPDRHQHVDEARSIDAGGGL